MGLILRLALLAVAGLVACCPARADEAASAPIVLGRIARQMFELRPVPARLDLPTFRAAEGGLGDCDTELRDRLIEAMKVEQADPDNAVVDRRIDIRLPPILSGSAEAEARVAGRYGVERDGRIWVEAQVIGRDGTALAALPRSHVSGLLCRGARQSLADAVEATIRGRRAQGLGLSLPRNDPRVGDLVAVTLRNDGPEAARVLCLNIAADDTAQVLTPLRAGAPRLPQRGQLVWPRDFTASGGPAGPICFEREQSDALLCLGLAEAPDALERRWRDAWSEGTAEPAELTAEATLGLVGDAISAPQSSAAFLRYTVRRALPGGTSACGRSPR